MSDAIMKVKPKVSDLVSAAADKVQAGLVEMAEILSRPGLKIEQAAFAYQTISKDWVKPLEDMKKAARQAMLERIDEEIPGDDLKKTLPVKYGGMSFSITKQTQRSSQPDEEELRRLLKSKKIKVEDAFTQVVSVQLDPLKLESLVKIGKLSQEEVDACRKTKAVQLLVQDK